MLPIEFEIRTLRIAITLNLDMSATQQGRMQHSNALNEYRQKALSHTEIVQHQKKQWNEEIRTLRIAITLNLDMSATQQGRMQHLNALNEYRQKALLHTEIVQH